VAMKTQAQWAAIKRRQLQKGAGRSRPAVGAKPRAVAKQAPAPVDPRIAASDRLLDLLGKAVARPITVVLPEQHVIINEAPIQAVDEDGNPV
jgi:hypothetical protein